MDKFLQANYKLLYCYQNVSSQEEADEKCQKYAVEAKNMIDAGQLDIDRLLKQHWKFYYSKQY